MNINPLFETVEEWVECPEHGSFPLRRMAGLGIKTGCSKCHERVTAQHRVDEVAARGARYLAEAGIPRRFERASLSDLRSDGENAEAHALVREYLENLETKLNAGAGLILCGNIGTGKTHSVCHLVRAACERGRRALFVSLADFLARVRSTYGDGAESEDAVMRRFTDPSLLAIDEVRAEVLTDHGRETLFRLINKRYNAGRATLITSNLQPKDLAAAAGAPTVDRLRSGGGAIAVFRGSSGRG